MPSFRPCNIARDGNATTWNPYSWTNVSNMIFIDQPVGTGFSYSDFGNTTYPSTSEAIAADIFDFMLGWYAKFPKYANLPLHLAGESWAGHMLPYSAVLIQKHNQELRAQGRGQKVILLESVMLGNALTSAFYQLGSVPQYLCQGPYALPLTAPECQDLEAKADKCKELIKICYDTDEEFDCVSAHEVCWTSGDLAAPVTGDYSFVPSVGGSRKADMHYQPPTSIHTILVSNAILRKTALTAMLKLHGPTSSSTPRRRRRRSASILRYRFVSASRSMVE
jgi:cathepsin A (carboxypeptidase C)